MAAGVALAGRTDSKTQPLAKALATLRMSRRVCRFMVIPMFDAKFRSTIHL
jgi:hypothetical protein